MIPGGKQKWNLFVTGALHSESAFLKSPANPQKGEEQATSKGTRTEGAGV